MPVPYSAASDALAEYNRRGRERRVTETALQISDNGHVPEQWDTCPDCGGEGVHERSRPQHDDPYFAVVETCKGCNGVGLVDAEIKEPK